MNLGILFKLKKKYKLAIYYSKKLIELIKEQKNKYKLLASALCNIGDCYLSMGNFKEYEKILLKSI